MPLKNTRIVVSVLFILFISILTEIDGVSGGTGGNSCVPGSHDSMSHAQDLAQSVNAICDQDLLNPPDPTHIRESAVDAAYVVMGSVPGPNGGRLRIAKRVKPFEISEGRNAFRGDPRWNFQLLGPKVARYFGFEERMNGEVIVFPDAVELNARIQKFNFQANESDKLTLKFFEPVIDRVSDEEYKNAFFERGEHPAAAKGDESMHDVNFHFPGIFLPQVVVSHLQNTQLAFSRFFDLAASHHVHMDKWARNAGLLESTVDKVTGGISVSFNSNVPDTISLRQAFGDPFNWWVLSEVECDKSPLELVKTKYALRGYPADLLNLFVESNKNNPRLTEKCKMTGKEIKKETVRRIQKISKDIEKLEADKL